MMRHARGGLGAWRMCEDECSKVFCSMKITWLYLSGNSARFAHLDFTLVEPYNGKLKYNYKCRQLLLMQMAI